MMHFNFIASDNFDLNSLNDVNTFVDNYPDFQTVVLLDEDQLKLLLELMGIREFSSFELSNGEFSKYWDLSHFKFPDLDDRQFEQFYKNWIQKSNRDNNMDEYGSLIFLQGLSSKWNRLNHRLIVKENT
jgi:hypothetical protein